jgi:3D (Asp-Asp-Asp) domain-containing protein
VAADSAVANTNAQIALATERRDEIQAAIADEQQLLAEAQGQLDEREKVLEKRLLSTYKSDDSGFIEVMMGSNDFSDFLTRVDMVNAIADEDRALIESIRSSKQTMEDELAVLQDKKDELAGLLDELNASRQELLAAQAEQQAVLASVQSQRDLTAGQIAQVQAEAASIETTMSSIQSQAPSPVSGGAGDGAPAGGGSSLTVTATAYCLAGSTATGMPVGRGIIAVDPGVIPLGSRVHVSGYGDAIAADTGGSVYGNRIDVWLPCGEANAWGVRTVTVTVY